MNIARLFNALACSAVLLGTLTFCLADDRPFLALLAIPIVFMGWICGLGWARSGTVQGVPWALPRFLVNLLVLATIINAAMHAAGSRSGGQPIVSHLGEFLVYVQLLKLFDRRTTRDESQMLTLSVFVAIAALLTSNSLSTGLCLLIYIPLAVTATMLFQLHSGKDRINEVRGQAAGVVATSDAKKPITAAGMHFGRHLRRTAVMSVLGAGTLAAIIFMITPRGLGVGALGQFGQTRTVQIGFRDQITLGQAANLQESPTPVLDLSLSDSAGANLGSADKLVYLRAFTRDEYVPDSFLWVKSAKTNYIELDLDPGSAAIFPRDTTKTVPDGSTVFQNITLRPSISSEGYLLSMWRPIGVTTREEHVSRLKFDRGDATIKRTRSNARTFSYSVESAMNDVEWNREPVTNMGFASGPIHDLAASILVKRRIPFEASARERGENRQAASAIRDHLQRTCTYTLDLWPASDGLDPLETFLFEKKTGHCQYFASAFVALCQSVGIHARVVGGFVAGEYNSLTGSYVVRQSNAHAWAEYSVGDGSWAMIDPSPSADVSRIHRSSSGWFSAMRKWWDTLEFGWNRSIVSFDAAKQSSAVSGSIDLSAASKWFERLSERLSRSVRNGSRSVVIPGWVYYLVPSFMLLATLAVVTGKLPITRWLSSLKRVRQPMDPQLRALLADAAFYEQAVKVLERAGPEVAKPNWVPPLAHADALASRNSDAAESFRTLSKAYYLVRFGRRAMNQVEQAQAHAALASLRTALRSK